MSSTPLHPTHELSREDLLARLWFLESLDQVDRAIRRASSIEQMMGDVLDVALEIFGAERTALLQPADPGATSVSIVMERTRSGIGRGLWLDEPLADGLHVIVTPKVEHAYLFRMTRPALPPDRQSHGQQLFEEIGHRMGDALTALLTVRTLRESEAKLHDAQRIAQIGYWENDLDRDRITWSDETYRILGLHRGEVEVTMSDFRDRIHPDDVPLQAAATASAQRGEGRYDLEYRLVRPNGDVRTVYSVGDVIRDASGRSHRAFGVVQDITDRKRAERALSESTNLLRAIVDSTADVIFVKDLKGRYLLMNAAGTRSRGRTVEQVIGKDDIALYPADVARSIVERDRQVMTSGEPQTFEETLQTAAGSRTFVTTKSVFRDADGNVLGLIGISSDVTQLKLLEEQFRQSQKMEAVGQLAGGVAHDFNNLLTVITAYADMLREGAGLDSSSRSDIDQILVAAQRAAKLTRQLLAFSRRDMLQPSVVDPNEAVRTVATMLERVIGEDITIVTELDPEAWRVYADAGQLEQVLMNLAVNGRDAMPRGGTLLLRTTNAEADLTPARDRPGLVTGEYTVLIVEDTGTGIDAATLPHLFEPFFTTKPAGKGTGLGLATAYGIVKQSHGFIHVDSIPGRGSRFSIYLPRHHGSDDVAARPAALVSPNGTEVILLVEDDADVRPALRRMLEKRGYTVLVAEDGAAALEVMAAADARGEHVDLVLSDVVMPVQGGRALGEQLAVHRPGIRVLYMSGYTDDEILRRGLVVPGANFLQKPFTSTRLAEAVRHALDKPDS